MMSSVVTEGKLQQAVSLQGVDPETCMIVFKNHWTQVMYESLSLLVLLTLEITLTINWGF